MISHYDKRELLRFVISDLVKYYATSICNLDYREELAVFFLREIANAAKVGNSQYDYTFLVRSDERT
jgi:hypothetical protein